MQRGKIGSGTHVQPRQSYPAVIGPLLSTVDATQKMTEPRPNRRARDFGLYPRVWSLRRKCLRFFTNLTPDAEKGYVYHVRALHLLINASTSDIPGHLPLTHPPTI